MGLGSNYARPLAQDTTFQIYYAPVGDPALGTVAFPHRASASELPQATLGHHWQDSSHIVDNVVTVALITFTHRNLNSFLAETVLPARGKNFFTGRFELVDKDELFVPAARSTVRIEPTA
ncbi:MAG: hypothetical protein M3Z23_06510 [Acidobacteriota bacterium]|nr:hypothetical protein [Acidobacteriota bacterium]